jgi:hypothetical protein
MIAEADMVAFTQQEQKVIELFRSLEPQRRTAVLLEMARTDKGAWKNFQAEGEQRLRELANQKGLDWDRLSDEQRQEFVEELLDGEGA